VAAISLRQSAESTPFVDQRVLVCYRSRGATRTRGVHGPDVGSVVNVDAITAQYSNEAPITFGALFGFPTLERTVTSTSQPIRTQNASGAFDVFVSPEGTSI
jgi:hypothetical protein